MSDDATAVTDDTTTEDTPAADETVAEETTEATASADEETPASDEAPVAEAAPVAEEAPVTEETPGSAFPGVRVARVFVCERGHRTTTLWGTPEICQARVDRKGPVCGLPLYHITELPEQVEKALNPLKASKKASKKK